MLRDLPRTVVGVLVLAVLIIASFWILRPFLLSFVWAMMIVVATWPLMLKLQARLRRRAPAVMVMSLAMLLVFFAPVVLMIQTLAENTDTIVGWIHALEGSEIPPPPAWVQNIPLVGDKVRVRWTDRLADAGKGALPHASRPTPPMPRSGWHAAGSVGVLAFQLLLTLIISVILYSTAKPRQQLPAPSAAAWPATAATRGAARRRGDSRGGTGRRRHCVGADGARRHWPASPASRSRRADRR